MKIVLSGMLALLGLAGIARADDTAAEQAQRWNLVRDAVYGDRAVQDAGDAVRLTMADRAQDAALVPVTVDLDTPKRVVALSLLIDNNPSPMAGTFHFGPAISPSQIKIRVRVDAYTLVHAVAETEDGTLLVTSHFIKAAGGCSAPGASDPAAVNARIGHMQLRRVRSTGGTGIPAQLLISHPNYNGMQSSSASNSFIPARFLEVISVDTGGVKVFELESSISLSEDPAITFNYIPEGDHTIGIEARDSTGAVFKRRFAPLEP